MTTFLPDSMREVSIPTANDAKTPFLFPSNDVLKDFSMISTLAAVSNNNNMSNDTLVAALQSYDRNQAVVPMFASVETQFQTTPEQRKFEFLPRLDYRTSSPYEESPTSSASYIASGSVLVSPNTPPVLFQAIESLPDSDMDIIFSATALLKMHANTTDMSMGNLAAGSEDGSDTESISSRVSSVRGKRMRQTYEDATPALNHKSLTIRLPTPTVLTLPTGKKIKSRQSSHGGGKSSSKSSSSPNKSKAAKKAHSGTPSPKSTRQSLGGAGISETVKTTRTRPRAASRDSASPVDGVVAATAAVATPVTGRQLMSSESAYTPLSPSLRNASSWVATPSNMAKFDESTNDMDPEERALLRQTLDKFGSKIAGLELIYKPATKRKPQSRWIPSYVFQKCITIEEVYQEYKYGVDGMISLLELEEDYASEWVLARKDIKHEKFRRMRVVRELQRIMAENLWSEDQVLRWAKQELTDAGINARKWGDSLPKTTTATTEPKKRKRSRKHGDEDSEDATPTRRKGSRQSDEEDSDDE